ncbi:MAG: hypothetical protein LAN18_05110 [Acidobacteriia bacterium]|nr:hypothetical protein [Terriglobia bacterium]
MDFNNRGIEIARYSDAVLNRARAIRQKNPSVSFEQAFTQAQQELGEPQFAERNHMQVDPNSIKLRDRALEIQETKKITFGEALRQARAERGPEFSENRGASVNPESVKLRDRALAIKDENPSLNFGEALRHARAERGPQFTEGGTPVDPQSIKLLDLAVEIARENPKMRFGEALRQARLEIET